MHWLRFAGIVFTLSFPYSTDCLSATVDIQYVSSFGKAPSRAPSEFNYPSGVAVDAGSGDVYVMDTLNHRIQRFDAFGNYLAGWRSEGGMNAAVDASDHSVYVASQGRHRISKYDPSGNLLAQWGGPGAGIGQFNTPRDVAVHPSTGHVFVLDSGNRRVQEFSPDGTYVSHWDGAAGLYKPYGISLDPSGQHLYIANTGVSNVHRYSLDGQLTAKWGTLGSGAGQFRWPRGIAVDAAGDVYIADTDMERIQKFDANGNFIEQFQGPHNEQEGPFHPRAVDVNTANGHVYATASYAHRVDQFDETLTHRNSWGHLDKDGEFLNSPKGIAVDATTGEVYVADTQNHMIKRFTRDGTFDLQFGATPFVVRDETRISYPAPIAIDASGNIWVLNQGITYPDDPTWASDKYVRRFDRDGNFLSGFAHADFRPGMNGLAIHPVDMQLYIAHSTKHKVMVFGFDGTLLNEFGAPGQGPGEFNRPAGIGMSPGEGLMFIVDSGNNRVEKFTLAGEFLLEFGQAGQGPGEFNFNPHSGISVWDNYLYVADTNNHRIQIFDLEGNFIAEHGEFGYGLNQYVYPSALAIAGNDLFVLETSTREIESYGITATPLPASVWLFLTGLSLLTPFALRGHRSGHGTTGLEHAAGA